MAIHSIELFAGVGMLGEGVRAVFDLHGIKHKTVCYVEREAPAAAQLVALMEAGAIDAAPVWSDVATFDGSKWRGVVDFIVAGFPCQDISVAGRRAGLDGDRSGLFFHILDIAEDCGARGIILENVSSITTAKAAAVDEDGNLIEERAVARVLGEMADRGWNAEWLTLRASDVGASHQRNRWFCFAWKVADPGLQCEQSQQWQIRPESARTSESLADASSGCEASGQLRPRGAQPHFPGTGNHMAYPCEPRLPHTEQSGKSEQSQASWRGATAEFCGAPLFAPGPSDPFWRDILATDEGGTSAYAPAIKPGIRMLADGMALVVDESRTHQLRQVGNGVIPLQAASAITEILYRAFGKRG